jgi:hypothetical protein
MRLKLTTGLAALALAMALTSLPAFAQSPGRAANDGGTVMVPNDTQHARTKPLYNSVPQEQPKYAPGKAANDGGAYGPK